MSKQNVTGVRILKNGMRAGYVLQKDGTRRFRFLGMAKKSKGGRKKKTQKGGQWGLVKLLKSQQQGGWGGPPVKVSDFQTGGSWGGPPINLDE